MSVCLQISEIERLAKAGVKIELTDITPQSDVPEPTLLFPGAAPVSLNESFWQRWRRANPPDPYKFGQAMPWSIHAEQYQDKVYVMVAPNDAPPFIIEDEAPLYPSDALMAKLHLYEKSK